MCMVIDCNNCMKQCTHQGSFSVLFAGSWLLILPCMYPVACLGTVVPDWHAECSVVAGYMMALASGSLADQCIGIDALVWSIQKKGRCSQPV